MRVERTRNQLAARLEKLEPRTALAADFYLSAQNVAADVSLTSASNPPPLTTLGNTGVGWGEVDYVRANYGLGGAGQTVAVIDSGVAYDHIALGGGFGAGRRVVGGWDFAENDADPYDDAPAGYHGTHVAGIVAANDAANPGLAPNADIVALRVFNDQGQGYFSWVELALRWVHKNRDNFENPITTVNLSMGAEWNSSTLPNWSTMEDEFAQLKADGITICVAAGNSFATYNAAGVNYPAVSPNVTPVASLNQAGSFSAYSQRNQRVLAAPGEFIRSTAPDWFTDNNGVKNDWKLGSGTSMATPYVSGASLLVRQAMQRLGYASITPDAIYTHLFNTSDIIYDPATQANYHRINLRRAIDSLAGADDYGNSAGTALALGTWQGARTVSGKVQSLGDQDYFRFTAAQSGTLTFTLQGAEGQSVTWAAAAGGTLGGGKLTLQVVAGQSYTVGVGASGIGAYQVRGELVGSTNNIQAVNWGGVDFKQINSVAVGGEQWFSVTASRTGILSTEAFFQTQRGNVDLEIYSSSQQLLGSSRGTSGSERVDANVTAGGQYFVKVLGANQSVNFRLTNLLSQSGGVLEVNGTSGADTVVWNGIAANTFVLNGVSYSGFAGLTNLNFHLGAGADSVTLLGSSTAETATLRPGAVELTGGTLGVTADGVETIRLYGQAADTLQFFDSAGDDLFDASPGSAMMRGDQFSNYSEGYATASAIASAGNDVAKLFDSAGADTFEARPTQATLRGPGYNLTASNFDAVVAIGGRGGNDEAIFYDSSDSDSFTARPSSAVLSGPGYYLSAERFATMRAYATAGLDQATLNGSGQSALSTGMDSAAITDSRFTIQVDGFESIRTSGVSPANDAVFQNLDADGVVGDPPVVPIALEADVAEIALAAVSARSKEQAPSNADELFSAADDWLV